MKSLEGKVAVVTGAAQGMGLETSLELARRGATVVATDIQKEKLGRALEALKAIHDRVASLPLDVSNQEQWSQVVETVRARYGSIDILVNNAAIFKVTRFEDISGAEWDSIFSVNVKGVLFGSQAVAPAMRQQKSGRIINFSSQAGKTGGLLVGAHYSASKAAVICLTKTLAASLASDNVTVNAVAPGIINTDFLNGVPGIDGFFSRIPLGRKPGEAIDVANAVAFLASDDARYITGEILDVNGGLLMD